MEDPFATNTQNKVVNQTSLTSYKPRRQLQVLGARPGQHDGRGEAGRLQPGQETRGEGLLSALDAQRSLLDDEHVLVCNLIH